MSKIPKSTRLAAIEALPDEMQDHALVDWRTVAHSSRQERRRSTRERS